MKTYIGITIGPIARVQNYARKTRGVWASSYIFSYIARNIIQRYFDDGHKFIKPMLDKDMFTIKDGVGRFPDQYIFEKKEDDSLEQLRNDCDSVIQDIADDMVFALKRANKESVLQYLRRNFRIIVFEQCFDDTVVISDVIRQMQQTMDIMECRDSFCAREERNYIAEYIETTDRDSLLVREIAKNRKSNLFSTIIECATCGEFTNNMEGSEKKKVIDDLNNGRYNGLLKPYQKYIALVCGDGDNFGRTLAKHGSDVADVFKNINNGINKKVVDYGGQLVYQGGDDILFFAPVYNHRQHKDIFGLIKDIDSDIQAEINKNKILKDMEEASNKPSFSFGVSISYYKHPIAETRQNAELLLSEIKNVKPGDVKNKIKWNVRKHSGQTFDGIIDKNNSWEIDKFVELVNDIMSRNGEEGNFLHSVTYWLSSDETMLSYILQGANREVLLTNYVKSNFDEDIHEEYKKFFDAVIIFLINCEGNSGLHKLHCIMRYITLLLKEE